MTTPEIQVEIRDGHAHFTAQGDWRLPNLPVPHPALPPVPSGAASLDGAALTGLDTSGALALLQALRDAGADPTQVEWVNFCAAHRAVLELVASHFAASVAPPAPPRRSLPAQTGLGFLTMLAHLRGVLGFVGLLTLETFGLLRHPGSFRMKEFTAQIEAVFVNAIPLAFAMMFLLGLVFAYLLGIQAEQYGANIFVVDGVALAVCRELAPVIVAILVAGRSGAAMTAQIGTMKVNEEIDAISVLGLSPYRVLVVPRILALLIALPLLVYIGDVAGLLGGMLVADHQLGIEAATFVNRLDEVLATKTVVVGLVKAPVFALFIGIIACRMGFTVARDARSVGMHTTSTVVQSIVAVIILDAIFAIAFVELGI